jgi:hypothetical protein
MLVAVDHLTRTAELAPMLVVVDLFAKKRELLFVYPPN